MPCCEDDGGGDVGGDRDLPAGCRRVDENAGGDCVQLCAAAGLSEHRDFVYPSFLQGTSTITFVARPDGWGVLLGTRRLLCLLVGGASPPLYCMLVHALD